MTIVNFQLTMLIAYVTCIVGRIMHNLPYAIELFLVLILLNLVLMLFNSWRIWKGKAYDYILSIPFLRTSKETYQEC
ncbi:MAG: DUF4870 domain-containing protein [Pedobacter sp.]|nr:MAG: DUF4870 domain-containing protein [Pedobacter sp.]